MTFMDLSSVSPTAFLIICPLVFLAGLIDAIAGGGGLISVTAYIIAGIPVHSAIATNKLSASFGTSLAAVRFIKNGMVNFKLGLPSIFFAIAGSSIGTNISLKIDEAILMKVLIVILPVTAFIVLNKRIFHDNPDNELKLTSVTFVVTFLIAFFIGIYDGFFGPGAGTFMIICFTVFGKMNAVNANGQTKLINVTTTVTSMIVFMMNGAIFVSLGIVAGICNMAGSYIGTGLVMTKGIRIVKPAIIVVLSLLALKVAGVY